MLNNSANLFVISAPSGAGKTTLVKNLVKRNPALRFSISYTTRPRRDTEVEGRDYFFVDESRFNALKAQGELLEYALVFDNHYATSRSQVEQHLAAGNHVILEIDWQGAGQVRESMPACISVFVLPPSRPELERRLRDRQTDSDSVIARRLRDSLSDMSHAAEFDFVIVNDDLETAVGELEGVLRGQGDANRSDTPEVRQKLEKILV
jgi:guanylate kinase